jgi:hypothetical protein
VLFDAMADGRLHLTAVLMLARRLTSGNVDDLVAAATHKSKAEIEQLIAERFPQPDLPEMLQAIGPPPPPITTIPPPQGVEHSPENAAATMLPNHPTGPGPTHQHSPENAVPRTLRSELKPLAPGRFGLQVTLDRETYELLQHVRALMSHEVPTGETALVLKGALKLAAGELEKRKYAATNRPGPSRPCASARHIPAELKRAVRDRREAADVRQVPGRDPRSG